MAPRAFSFQVIPVLDVMHGNAVRGIAGRREDYRPIVSQLTTSTDPVVVAQTLVDTFRPSSLYVADLDAIRGGVRNRVVDARLAELPVSLWIDAGVRTVADASDLAEDGFNHIIVGLETVAGFAVLQDIVRVVGVERLLFSLDLKAGQCLGALEAWPKPTLRGVLADIAALGIDRLIVLDLAQVGIGKGTGTESLCSAIASAYPEIQVFAGGGVRSIEDLRAMKAVQLTGALVSSALHSGQIRPDELPV